MIDSYITPYFAQFLDKNQAIWKTWDGYTISVGEFSTLHTQCLQISQQNNFNAKNIFFIIADNHPDVIALMMSFAAFAKCVPIPPNITNHELLKISENILPDAIIYHQSRNNTTEIQKYCTDENISLISFFIENSSFSFSGSLNEISSRNKFGLLDSTPGWIFHTSGTTGQPRAIFLSNANILKNAEAMRDEFSISPNDINLHTLPIFHVGGIIQSLITSFVSGATSIFWNPLSEISFKNITDKFHPTWFTSSPAIHKLILNKAKQENYSPSGYRFVRSSSAYLNAQTMQEMLDFYQTKIISAYGATEAAGQISYFAITNNDPFISDNNKNCIGIPIDMEISIFDENEQIITIPEKIGRLAYKGKQVAEYEFINHQCKTIQTSTGWFISEDYAFWDNEQNPILLGRSVEIINRGGELISAKEIENVIIAHPDVMDCAVTPITDPFMGQEICAFLVRKQDISIQHLKKHILDFLSPQKIPGKFIFLDQLPLLPNFKIDYEYLRNNYLPTKGGVFNADIYTKLKVIWKTIFRSEEISPNESFYQFGVDSLQITELAITISETFNITVLPSEIFSHDTFDKLLDLINEKIK